MFTRLPHKADTTRIPREILLSSLHTLLSCRDKFVKHAPLLREEMEESIMQRTAETNSPEIIRILMQNR